MKLIAWNCNMAFRKKAEFILPYNPDIAVISECENPEKLKFPADSKLPTDILWYGTNPHKGLGVFSYSDYRFQLLDCHNPDFKNILPIAVTGEVRHGVGSHTNRREPLAHLPADAVQPHRD